MDTTTLTTDPATRRKRNPPPLPPFIVAGEIPPLSDEAIAAIARLCVSQAERRAAESASPAAAAQADDTEGDA